ncbi:phage minor head protein [Chryseobacterium indologenes]|uniref:Phage head morphogenesis domain-containing protein n=1 Tax=Chryseobacterium indologenes TaxID=253 RepID=A0A0N1KR59_CHRID|nr:phage minor head protein [Chryseobacterium indologenes]KPE49759.1 hypothetical protein AOB46_18720 [Chryseobacterium indologenes]
MSDQVYNSYILHFNAYMAKALKLLIPEFRKQLKRIPFDNLSFGSSTALIMLNFDKESMRKVLYKIHYTIGRAYGYYSAQQLRKENPIQEKKWKPLPFFNEAFQKFLLDYYRDKGGELIVTLSRTMAERVTQDIISGTFENETVEQMRDRMMRTVNDPKYYEWMCMRIARTETGFAMNAGQYTAGDVSGVLMEKVWIAKRSGHRRDEHQRLDGKTVGPKEYFKLSGGVELRFPCDRDGKGSRKAIGKQVINCACTYGFRPVRDENGRLIFTE